MAHLFLLGALRQIECPRQVVTLMKGRLLQRQCCHCAARASRGLFSAISRMGPSSGRAPVDTIVVGNCFQATCRAIKGTSWPPLCGEPIARSNARREVGRFRSRGYPQEMPGLKICGRLHSRVLRAMATMFCGQAFYRCKLCRQCRLHSRRPAATTSVASGAPFGSLRRRRRSR